MSSTPPNDNDRLLTCRQVAVAYKVHTETVRRWVRKGVIGVIRVGPHRAIRIPKSEAVKHFMLTQGAKT